MIEITVRNYLINALDVPCYMGEKPADHPQEYIVLNIIDGGRSDFIDAVTFNITSYSTSLQKAAELNLRVKDSMFNMISIPNISSSKCGGGGQSIDTITKEYAYECIFNIKYTEE